MRKVILVVVGLGAGAFFYFRTKSEPKPVATVVESSQKKDSNYETAEKAQEEKTLRRVKKRNKVRQTENEELVESKKNKRTEPDNSLSAEERKAQKLESYAVAAKLEETAANMDRQMERALAGVMNLDLSENQRKALNDIRERVSGERYLRELKDELSKNLTESELSELTEIYNDPDVSDMVSRKYHYQTPEGQQEFAQQMAQFDPNSIPNERRQLLNNLNKSSMEKDQAINSMSKIFRASMNLAGGKNGGGMSEAQLKAFTASMSKNFDRAALAMAHNNTKGLSDEKLRALTKKFGSEAYRKQQKVVTGMGASMTNEFVDIMNDNAANG